MITFLSIFTLVVNPTPNSKHIIPESIKEEALFALTCYPELEGAEIEFKFKEEIKKSTMQARPTIASFFQKRRKRSYEVLISKRFKISGKEFKTEEMPKEVLIGWLGHELGHIMDYQNRNRFNLIGFGIKYLFVENHLVEAERAADYFAIQAGMEEFILATKDFILKNALLDPKYVERIKKYYQSPEEIMEMVRIRDKRKTEDVTL